MSEVVVITTDDLEPAVRLRGGFQAAGFQVELLTGGESLADVVGEPTLLILTAGIQERRARKLITEARARPRLPIIGLLEETQPANRDTCRALGLNECFAKPIDVEEVVLVGRRTIERERLREITGIVGDTEVMEEVLERVVQIAGVDSTVLIQGESGTGKELVARGLHALSPRRHKPFIAVNVAALPDTLLESELFGHEKGAFTGAASLRKGLFELASTGTIFLDEIGEMAPTTQTKLLRILEEREFRRVGGEDVLRVDVRVIAATNRDLREQVELGEFRRDLYHRLNVLRIILPPLRERRQDIPRLIDQFVREFSAQHDRPFPGIAPDALELLVDYAWPGNVRELRNLIESMVVLAHGEPIRREDIPAEVRSSGRVGSFLPVLVRQQPRTEERPAASPELEFILRTILDLKIDMEDLRREMDDLRYRSRAPVAEVPFLAEFSTMPNRSIAELEMPEPEPEPEGVVVYKPGMTMQDMEREAITAALSEVRGNRRRAAEMLGIGERTLYRKIKEFGLDP
jgi:DNA-binding NtrC family response regulator